MNNETNADPNAAAIESEKARIGANASALVIQILTHDLAKATVELNAAKAQVAELTAQIADAKKPQPPPTS
jgi:hypothetical protein